MDFSAIDTHRIQWGTPIKNKSKCLQKLRFQLPMASLKLVPCPKFEGALELSVDASDFPSEFNDFMDELLDTVPDESIGFRSYYAPWKRMTAFDDVLAFDAEGNVIKNIAEKKGYHEASLLLQIDGLWFSERLWGVRFRVAQIKLHKEHIKPLEEEPPVRIFLEGKPFLFVQDDD
jgi:hypothetical protein